VDAIYIATPHELHAQHVITALEHDKHVIVEKPMALSLDEARQMYEAADRNGVKLMVGHTHSFDPPVKKMREIVASGELGRLLMVSSSYYKDHMYRPFSDHDIQTSRGVVLNQGPHQVDIVRLIGGGLVRSVRAGTGIGDPLRPGEGHYAAFLQFQDGAAASLVYSGYGYFDTGELVWGLGEGGEMKDPERHVKARKFFAGLGSGEDRAQRLEQRLEQWRYGGQEQGQWAAQEEGERRQPFFGLTIVTCEKGDIRQSPDGLFIYDEHGRREVVIPQGVTAREAEMNEFFHAIAEDRPVEHDGRWGAATIEVCLGILESSETGREVSMKEQVPAA
jgi:phthalate 4,5-cis-dihydrodiol dehydrogenase